MEEARIYMYFNTSNVCTCFFFSLSVCHQTFSRNEFQFLTALHDNVLNLDPAHQLAHNVSMFSVDNSNCQLS